MKTLFLILTILSSSFAFAQGKKVAVVKIVRGEVDVLTLGKTVKLKVDDWVQDGAVVKTAEKSFAKLVFIDKSQMNIGPNSEMKIEKFADNDSGVIDLVKGKIRSQVTKDYLQMKDKDKSKLFIKTPNAVMGIRGTDFMISTNGKNTAAILFEGEVVFNKLETRGITDSSRLEQVVDAGVRMNPGEFSVVDQHRATPTIPSVLNVQQREALEKNESFDKRAPSNANSNETAKTVVPAGLTGVTVSNESSALKNEVAQVAGAEIAPAAQGTGDVDGFVKGDAVKPANGSVVHVDSGLIIPPGADSALDKNTNSYGLSNEVIVDAGGDIQLKGKEITSEGTILATVVGAGGKTEVVVQAAPSVVKPSAPVVVPVPGSAPAASVPVPPVMKNPDITMNPNGVGVLPPPPSGGVQTVNDAVQQFNNSGPRARTINVGNGN